MAAKYNVFRDGGSYVSTIIAASSFEARKIVSEQTGLGLLEFYAVRDDLMTDKDRKRAMLKAAIDSGKLEIVDFRTVKK